MKTANYFLIRCFFSYLSTDLINGRSIFFLIFWFFTLSSALEAQQVVTGRIMDATDGKPIPDASIFIANTTIGTTSDESGYYSITVPVAGSFEIGVSHIGYQPVFHKIDTPKSSHQVYFVLEIRELPEVVVVAHSNYRQADVNLFWRKLLGVRPSKNRLEVLNPEKVYFYRNSENVLHVSCNEPIDIVNHEMGYRIRYVLRHFQHDYRKDHTTFSGLPSFEALVPQNNRQQSNWAKKRREVYAVSFTRFMRALYRDQIHENGFLLTKKDSVLYATTSFPLKNILQVNQETVTVNIETPLLLACLSVPVTTRMIEDTWHTFYGDGARFPLLALLPQRITVFSDGSYTGILEIEEYRNPISGLSYMLPVEYDGNDFK